MGFVSMFEDILERCYSSAFDATSPPSMGASTERARKAIEALCAEYEHRPEEMRRLRELSGSFLGRVDTLIRPVKESEALLHAPRGEDSDSARLERLDGGRRRLAGYFSDPNGIPLSYLDDHERLHRRLVWWRDRAASLRAEVQPVINILAPDERQRLADLVSRIEADIDWYGRKSKTLEEDLAKTWEAFKLRHRTILSLLQRRPTLQHLDPWVLDNEQTALVEQDFTGVMTLHGTAGSGKTAVVLHRAIREALRSPRAGILLLTRQEPLAHRLRDAVTVLRGSLPENLRIDTLYGLWARVVQDLMGEGNLHRLRDGTRRGATERTSPEESNEQINSWLQFVRHTPTSIFKHDREVSRVRQNLADRLVAPRRMEAHLVADRYLYEEVSYIRSAFPRSELPTAYYDMDRVGRSLPLLEGQRQACYRILLAWEDWLRAGHVADLVGLTWRAADLVLDENNRERCRRAIGADHILVDELQDLSTLDLRMVNALGGDAEAGRNAFYFAGDLEQKGSYLHLDHRMAGFIFGRRVRHLSRNYRNTREILLAAYQTISDPNIRRQVRKDPDLEIRDPELSVFSGAPPIALQCSDEEIQARTIMSFVEGRRALAPPPAVAIVSQNTTTLDRLEAGLTTTGIPVTRIWGTDDRDQYLVRPEMVREKVVLGAFDSVRGLEFDTLIVANLSEELVPLSGAEPWRNAARLYSTLTRARDELVITLSGGSRGSST